MKKLILLVVVSTCFLASCKKEKLPKAVDPTFEIKLIQSDEAVSSTGLLHFDIKFSITAHGTDAKFGKVVAVNELGSDNRGISATVMTDDTENIRAKTATALTYINQDPPIGDFYEVRNEQTRQFMLSVFVSSTVKNKMYSVRIVSVRLLVEGKYYDVQTDDLRTNYMLVW